MQKLESGKGLNMFEEQKGGSMAGVWSVRVGVIRRLDSSPSTRENLEGFQRQEPPIICTFKRALWLLLRPCLEMNRR